MSREVLIAGASGLVGTAAVKAFLDAHWTVVASSRRAPTLVDDTRCDWLPLDLDDPRACREAVAKLKNVTHLVYAAVHEMPGLVAGWSDPRQIASNDRMFKNLLDPLADRLEHVTLLQGTKAYGATVQPMRVPAREDQPRVEHPNFYWLQEDHLRETAIRANVAFTVLRPQLIVGPNHGVAMNLPPVIGTYAAIRQFEGLPFSFPGGAEWVWEAADVRLVGNACLWAATHLEARGETYNLTNGEVFSFRDMWPALARTLNVPEGPDETLGLADYLPARAHIWDKIVRDYELEQNSLTDLLGESHHYADLCFGPGRLQQPAATFVSTVKIRQAGFDQACNTEQSFCYWLTDLIERRILPRFH